MSRQLLVLDTSNTSGANHPNLRTEDDSYEGLEDQIVLADLLSDTQQPELCLLVKAAILHEFAPEIQGRYSCVPRGEALTTEHAEYAAYAINHHCSPKIVMLGAFNAGKTSIAQRVQYGDFADLQNQPRSSGFPGFKTCRKATPPIPALAINALIWDTAGMEKYQELAPMYYRNAAAVLLVFDVSDRESFESAKGHWKQQHDKGCSAETGLVLVGNKADMRESGLELAEECGVPYVELAEEWVSAEEAMELAEEWGVPYVEMSAKTGAGFELAFCAAVEQAVRSHKDFDARDGLLGMTTGQERQEQQEQPGLAEAGGGRRRCCVS
jgi:small GTP-binding protein